MSQTGKEREEDFYRREETGISALYNLDFQYKDKNLYVIQNKILILLTVYCQ